MKSKSNRLITIETNRTVLVRQMTVSAQEWDLDYNSTTGANSNTTNRQSSTDSIPRTAALNPEPQNFNQTYSENGLGLVDSDSLLAGLQGEGDEILNLAIADHVTATKQPTTSQSSLSDLLDWLGEDREQAGIRYEEIRRALIKIFVCRGAHISEDLADETIDRVVRKLPEIRANYQGRPIDYFCGVAKKIYLEYFRKSFTPAVSIPAQAPVDEEQFSRLDRCLNKLTDADRTLILEYYGGERKQKIDGRKQIARRLGIPLNALRIRAHRIRTHLMELMLSD